MAFFKSLNPTIIRVCSSRDISIIFSFDPASNLFNVSTTKLANVNSYQYDQNLVATDGTCNLEIVPIAWHLIVILLTLLNWK
jgi:hypothetical protein